MDSDVEVKGVLGAGDVEVGFDRQNTRQLLTFVQRAKGIPRQRSSVWLLVGRADFSWSDRTESGSEDDPGAVYVESDGAQARLIIQPNNGAWMPYVATMGFDDLDKLSALLSRALDGS